MGVDRSHIRIEKVVDSKISGYAWTGSKLQAVFKYLPLIVIIVELLQLELN